MRRAAAARCSIPLRPPNRSSAARSQGYNPPPRCLPVISMCSDMTAGRPAPSPRATERSAASVRLPKACRPLLRARWPIAPLTRAGVGIVRQLGVDALTASRHRVPHWENLMTIYTKYCNHKFNPKKGCKTLQVGSPELYRHSDPGFMGGDTNLMVDLDESKSLLPGASGIAGVEITPPMGGMIEVSAEGGELSFENITQTVFRVCSYIVWRMNRNPASRRLNH